MQREPQLHILPNKPLFQRQPRHSISGFVFVCIALFFVVYGAFDMISRLLQSDYFTSAYSDTQAIQVASATGTIPVISSAETSAAVVQPFTPERLQIPSLGIDATIQLVGQTGSGTMATPKGFTDVAWYKLGSKPGAPGSVVIAGHLNNALGLAGVFEKLDTLPLGSEIIVTGEGRSIHYTVREMTVYGTNDAPTNDIFSTTGPSKLVLVTCDGAWDSGVKSYDKRLVLIADPQ